MILSDRQILEYAKVGMITPVVGKQKRDGVISYGVGSYGYDIRVADEFKIFTNVNNTVVDPKNFDEAAFVEFKGDVCIIPPNSFALARSVEYIKMPRNVTGLVLGKSTYARCGIVANFTPLEACYSKDTECLTIDGWKLISDVKLGELVLSLNPINGKATWDRVEQVHSYYHSGHLIYFDGRFVDLMVTPNHKMYTWKRSSPRKFGYLGEWGLIESQDIYKKHNYYVSRYVDWDGESKSTIQIGDLSIDAKKFAYFLGIYLGDGWTITQKHKGNYVIRLGAKKSRKVLSHSDAISGIGFTPHVNKNHSVQFLSKTVNCYLKKLGKATEKYIPAEIKNLSPDILECLLAGLIDSDGNTQTNTYYTSSKRLADDVQEIAYKIGKSAIVREIEQEETELVKSTKNTRYIVRISEKTKHEVLPKNHKLVPYNDNVYCVGVKNHIIFVRRNGKPMWCGNSWHGHITIEISNTTPLPAMVYANEGFAQILFFEGDECKTSYADRKGKYQGQTGITLPKL